MLVFNNGCFLPKASILLKIKLCMKMKAVKYHFISTFDLQKKQQKHYHKLFEIFYSVM
jgi:hypothetical protein